MKIVIDGIPAPSLSDTTAPATTTTPTDTTIPTTTTTTTNPDGTQTIVIQDSGLGG